MAGLTLSVVPLMCTVLNEGINGSSSGGQNGNGECDLSDLLVDTRPQFSYIVGLILVE